VVARISCSLRPDPTPADPKGMCQEMEIRYVVTNLDGSAAPLRGRLLPARTVGDDEPAIGSTLSRVRQ